ncbi:hypothetical protein [Enterobacter roggenkampii]|uniref:hypothetical protein n=1 Tax=Enterobacter roggenkampii TaxID=1812935 RepID=UPI002F2D033F
MKYISIIILTSFISACVYHPLTEDKYDKESGDVKIYSTSDMSVAKMKADLLCGKHSYYNKNLHESNISFFRKDPSSYFDMNYIPFQCDVYAAARAGNEEAKNIVNKEIEEAHRRLDAAKNYQYEVHKAYAKKHGGDSYSVINPDGSIEAHSIGKDGNACHSTVSRYGSETYCD